MGIGGVFWHSPLWERSHLHLNRVPIQQMVDSYTLCRLHIRSDSLRHNECRRYYLVLEELFCNDTVFHQNARRYPWTYFGIMVPGRWQVRARITDSLARFSIVCDRAYLGFLLEVCSSMIGFYRRMMPYDRERPSYTHRRKWAFLAI